MEILLPAAAESYFWVRSSDLSLGFLDFGEEVALRVLASARAWAGILGPDFSQGVQGHELDRFALAYGILPDFRPELLGPTRADAQHGNHGRLRVLFLTDRNIAELSQDLERLNLDHVLLGLPLFPPEVAHHPGRPGPGARSGASPGRPGRGAGRGGRVFHGCGQFGDRGRTDRRNTETRASSRSRGWEWRRNRSRRPWSSLPGSAAASSGRASPPGLSSSCPRM